MESITVILEEIRRQKGYKQEYVANKLGVKQSTFSAYISANNDIPFSRILKIANILDVEIIDVITYPQKYIPEQKKEECENCKEKDTIIRQLTNYITILENKNDR